jgi:adenylate kinase
MRLLLIGPPGCGKGTQGQRIAALYAVEHIAAGDILRAEVAAGTALGREMARYMSAGELVPDDVLLGVIMPRVFAAAALSGYVLDGFPRSVRQAVEARHMAAAPADSSVRRAVFMRVPHEELVARLLRRAEIEGRPDDTPTVIEHRLRVFTEATSPLLDFYNKRGLLGVVDGRRTADEVTEQIVASLPPLVRARPQG